MQPAWNTRIEGRLIGNLADIYLSALRPRHIRLHRNLRPLEFRRDDREAAYWCE